MDAEAEQSRWASQLADFERSNQATRNAIVAQLATHGVRPDVARRLSRLSEALQRHGERISGLLGAVGVRPSGTGSSGTSRVSNPVEERLDAYLHQVHRDWGWQEDHPELALARRALEAALQGGRPLGRMLVLGAGACRLPYALHRAFGAEITIALDVDVLAFTIAARILAGEEVELAEFPSDPTDAASMVVERRLRADPKTLDRASSFHLVFADGLDPPVASGAFDTVFTPWFIDQVPKDMATLFDVVHRVLRPGGTWLNHGPLIYHPQHTALIHRYTMDEVLALVGEAGFELEYHRFEPMPFLQSPASMRGRTETVLTFRARRIERVDKAAGIESVPPWLVDPDQPVPAWPGLQSYRPPHPMFAAIIALLDGNTSAREIAEILVRKHGVPEAAALGGVTTALSSMYRATHEAE